jgi:hypothetical protein
MCVTEPKLESASNEADFHILEEPQYRQPLYEEIQPAETPSAPHESTQQFPEANQDWQPNTDCQCQHCDLYKHFLASFQVHHRSLNHDPSVQTETPGKTDNPQPSIELAAEISKLKHIWNVCKSFLVNNGQKCLSCLQDNSRKAKALVRSITIPKLVTRVLATVLVAIILLFACYGIFAIINPPVSINRRDYDIEVFGLKQDLRSLKTRSDQHRLELENKDNLLQSLTKMLSAAKSRIAELTIELSSRQKTDKSTEWLMRLIGLPTASLNDQLDLQYKECVLQNFGFYFLGNHYSGEYRGQCVQNTAHGFGFITTPEGKEFTGKFRGNRMHGVIHVTVGDRRDVYNFVHGTENGYYHTKGYQNSETYGCMLNGVKIGAQVKVDTTGKTLYSLIKGQGGREITTLTVSEDRNPIELDTLSKAKTISNNVVYFVKKSKDAGPDLNDSKDQFHGNYSE